MVNYFIYYTWTKDGMGGDGNVDVLVDVEVSCIESVRKLEEGIKLKFDHDAVVICNYNLLG